MLKLAPSLGSPIAPHAPCKIYHIFWKEVSVAPFEDVQLWVVQCRILVQSPVLFSQRTAPLEKIQMGGMGKSKFRIPWVIHWGRGGRRDFC